MSESTRAVFLSYASQDSAAARRICDALRSAGLDVWFDQSELRGGDAWDTSIRTQVRECALFVPLISANTDARSEGYFRREWNLAVGRMLDMADDQAFLLPVVIDDTTEASARVPERFRERQWTRLPGGEAPPEFAEGVAHLLRGRQPRDLTTSMPAPATEARASDRATTIRVTTREDEGFRVAVLAFTYSGSNSDIAELAEGLREGIVAGMSRFSYLRVIAGNRASLAADVRTTGMKLDARYVMEGSIRQAASRLRIAVQLVDVTSGAHLWAESYERTFDAESLFELQDELVPRIVSTVADNSGVLPRSMSDALRNRGPEQLSPYEAVLRSFGYSSRVTAEELLAAKSGLESALRKAPAYADALSMLAWLYVQDYAQGFKLQPDALVRGLAAAQQAVEAAPSNHLAWFGLAQALFFLKESQSFRNAAERAVTLNPMDGNSIAFMGELLTYSGDSERGLALAARAKQLNPHHPGWYWYTEFYDAYRRRDYRNALAFALKANLPGHWGFQAAIAAANGQLGEREAAAKAVRNLLELRTDFVATVRADMQKWWDSEYVESFIDGLRKAGLEIALA